MGFSNLTKPARIYSYQTHFRFFDPAPQTDRSGVRAARRRSSVPVAPGASAPAEAQDERCVSAEKMGPC